MRERRDAYNVLVRRREGKRPLGNPRPRWEDNIKTGIPEVGWRGMDWTDLIQDSDTWPMLVNAVMNILVL